MVHPFYLHNLANIFRHYEYMKACIYGLSVGLTSEEIPDLIDLRYFYDRYDPKSRKNVGHYTCGICRNAVAGMLLANRLFFKDMEFLQSLPASTTQVLLGL